MDKIITFTKKILNYIWRIWFVTLAFSVILLFAIPVLLLSIKEKYYKFAYFFIWLFCAIVFFGMGFRYKKINKTLKKIDNRTQYIFIANHTSIIDIMLMALLHPKHPICFIGKAELAKIPLFGIIYRRICILVDRKNPKSRAAVYTKAAEKIKSGQSIVIFPEGGVPDDTQVILDEFKDGAFMLATKHQFPIVVYSFIGLKKMFPFDYSKGNPGKVKVVMNDILNPSSVKEMKENAYHQIKKTLMTLE